jgi:hypothetical protein
MMAVMRRQEAKSFSEQDEDPHKIFALFDAGQKAETAPSASPGQELRPLGPLLATLADDLRQLRLGDRLAVSLRHLFVAIRRRSPHSQ